MEGVHTHTLGKGRGDALGTLTLPDPLNMSSNYAHFLSARRIGGLQRKKFRVRAIHNVLPYNKKKIQLSIVKRRNKYHRTIKRKRKEFLTGDQKTELRNKPSKG